MLDISTGHVKSHPHDKSRIALVLCLIAGLLFSLYLLSLDPLIGYDGIRNVSTAKNIVSGNGTADLWKPPLYPLTIGILYVFLGNGELAGYLISIFFFLASIVLVFKLAGLIYNKNVACLSAALFTSNWLMLRISLQGRSHTFHIFLTLAILYTSVSLFSTRKLRIGNFAFLGVLIGLSILTRFESIITTFALVIILFIMLKERIVKKLLFFLCLLCITGAVVFPYVNFLHKHTGKWMLTTRLYGIKHFHALRSDPSWRPGKHSLEIYSKFDALSYAAKNRKEITERYQKGLSIAIKTLYALLYSWPGITLIALGLLRKYPDKNRIKKELLLCCGLVYLVMIPLGNTLSRYYSSAMPIFLIWMGKGLDNVFLFLQKSLRQPSQKRTLAPALILLLLVIMGFFTRKYLIQHKQVHLQNKTYKNMATWISNNIPDIQSKIIASRHASLAFYCGSKHIRLKQTRPHARFIAYLKHRGCGYLAINQNAIRYFPHLKYLLNDKVDHEGLDVVHILDKPGKIVLYKIE